MSRVSQVLLLLLTCLAAASTGLDAATVLGRSAAPTLADCDARVRRAPDDYDSYKCYIAAARGRGLHAEAVRRLDTLVQRRSIPPGALYTLAVLEQDRGRARAEALYRSAMEKARQAVDTRCEIIARAGLVDLLGAYGRLGEAKSEMGRALAAAEAAADPAVQAYAWIAAARYANGRADYGAAHELLARAETVAFPDGPLELQSQVLSMLGALSWAQGDFTEALQFYRRQLEILQQTGDLFHEAATRYNIALMYGVGRLADREVVSRLEREALAAAIRGNNREIAAKTHLSMGESLDGPESIEHFQQGLALAIKSETRLFALRCIGKATFELGPKHHAEGFRWIDQALEAARSQGSRHHFARARVLRACKVKEAHAPREHVIQEYLQTFEAVEAIRDLQPEGLIRARVFSQWIHPYYRFAGHLLETLEQSADPEQDVERAFRTSERLRARSLLDRFDAAGASLPSADAQSLHEERGQILDRIARLQQELMSLELSRERRQHALLELERLEREEGALRVRIARLDARFRALRAPEIPALRQVQEALNDDEAFLSFQVWYNFQREDRWETGGSWLYVITRGAVRVFPTPTRDVLDEQVAMFNGLFENRDGSEELPAAALYQDLLGAALQELPAKITRLIIVPDAALYRLPFAALRPNPGEPPLVTRFDLSYVPSATIWMRWRTDVRTIPAQRTLALADPVLQGDAQSADLRAADPWLEGLRAGRLSFARQEARTLVKSLGGGKVLSGAEASEEVLKRTDLKSFGTLVFAAHAVVDDGKPERSAVLLARGSPREDGLLQFREIVELDLKDRIVILSACRSAVGADLFGEGIMGLAHAFFQAGARSVIGSLWIVRDEEQSDLVRRLAGELARGRNLSAALAAAQRSLIAGGAPAAAWAGLVVLGDGERVPRPVGPSSPVWAVFWLATGMLGAAALVLLVRRRLLRERC